MLALYILHIKVETCSQYGFSRSAVVVGNPRQSRGTCSMKRNWKQRSDRVTTRNSPGKYGKEAAQRVNMYGFTQGSQRPEWYQRWHKCVWVARNERQCCWEIGDWNLERVLLGSNLQIVLYDWCEAAELQLAVQLLKVARNWNPHSFPPTKKWEGYWYYELAEFGSISLYYHIFSNLIHTRI